LAHITVSDNDDDAVRAAEAVAKSPRRIEASPGRFDNFIEKRSPRP